MSGVKKTFRKVDKALGLNFGEREAVREYKKGQDFKNEVESAVQNRKDTTLEAQQKAEISARQAKLTKTQMQFLKARFSLAGGAASSKGIATGFTPATGMQSSSDLFSKITGRN